MSIKPGEGGKENPPCISLRISEPEPWAFIDIGIFSRPRALFGSMPSSEGKSRLCVRGLDGHNSSQSN